MFYEATASEIGPGMIQCLEWSLIHRPLTVKLRSGIRYLILVAGTPFTHLVCSHLWRGLCDFSLVGSRQTCVYKEQSMFSEVSVNVK